MCALRRAEARGTQASAHSGCISVIHFFHYNCVQRRASLCFCAFALGSIYRIEREKTLSERSIRCAWQSLCARIRVFNIRHPIHAPAKHINSQICTLNPHFQLGSRSSHSLKSSRIFRLRAFFAFALFQLPPWPSNNSKLNGSQQPQP